MRLIKPAVKLEWITANAETLIERAGRVCYKSEDKITDESATKFIANIISRGHEAVLEHAVASLRFITDRGVTHEMVRHRLASYCQESTRYVKYDDLQVILPTTLTGHVTCSDCEKLHSTVFDSDAQCDGYGPGINTWLQAMLDAERAYGELIDAGYQPQVARSVLPTCTKTEIVMTANFREWRHFFKMRCDRAAHPDMRELALAAQKLLSEACPSCFAS